MWGGIINVAAFCREANKKEFDPNGALGRKTSGPVAIIFYTPLVGKGLSEFSVWSLMAILRRLVGRT